MLETNTVAKLKIMVKNYNPDLNLNKLKKADLIKVIKDHREHIATRGMIELKPEPVEVDKTPYHNVLQTPDFKLKEKEEHDRNMRDKQERIRKVDEESAKYTTEYLDMIAQAIQSDGTKIPYDVAFQAKLIAISMQMVNLFDDGEDVIIQAKLATQICRMFEKMRDNVETSGKKKQAELRTHTRKSNNLEIDQQGEDKLNDDIRKLRTQYKTLNWAFQTLVRQFYPKAIGQTGINWGQYETLQEMAKSQQKKARKEGLTVDRLMNDRENFDYHLKHNRHEDILLVEIPDGL